MAAKIVLGATPKTFQSFDVTVTLPDGSQGVIPVVFSYRTKRQFGKWMDEAVAQAKQDQKQASPADFSWEEFTKQNTDVAVGQLLSAVDSWGIDIPLTREALVQLDNEIPASVTALLTAYGAACREGRLGN